MTHYDDQREEQQKAWEDYSALRKIETIKTKKTIIDELLEVFSDTKEHVNITFRGFLLGNYTIEALEHDLPNLYAYVRRYKEENK